jgi:hypothetical protein
VALNQGYSSIVLDLGGKPAKAAASRKPSGKTKKAAPSRKPLKKAKKGKK